MARTTLDRMGELQAASALARDRLAESDFDVLYQRHYRDVYRYVLALVRAHDDTEDIASETFERAYRSWRSNALPSDHVLPWLLLTARRIATDRWRRLRRLTRVVSLVRSRDSDRTDQGRTEFWLWFDAVSEALPARQREVLVLRYQRDLSDADIALVLGVTESGVRSLVARALENLRSHPELLR